MGAFERWSVGETVTVDPWRLCEIFENLAQQISRKGAEIAKNNARVMCQGPPATAGVSSARWLQTLRYPRRSHR
jgi:hypothetical protein